MAPRNKKEETGTGEVMVSIEQYTRTRDSVILSLTNLQTGLTHVQTGLNDLLRAYMQHTSSILAGEDGDLDKHPLPANITATANAAMEAATSAAIGIGQVVNASNQIIDGAAPDAKNKKRKREKKEKDPNAPKKPLTAAFLYAQTARPIVRADLEAALEPGAVLEKNAVNLEVTKRWNDLPEEEKERWKASYRSSMEDYKVELADYLAKAGGGKVADVLIDEDMSDVGDVEMAEVGTVDTDVSSDDEDEPPVAAKAPSPPAKTPRPNKRQKTVGAATNGAAVPATPAATKDTPVPIPGSVRPSTSVPAPASSASEAPAKKDNKKKAKSAAPAPIAPAPAKEASPDESSKASKKSKSSRSTRGAEAEVEKENAAASTDKKKEKRDRSKRKSEVAST